MEIGLCFTFAGLQFREWTEVCNCVGPQLGEMMAHLSEEERPSTGIARRGLPVSSRREKNVEMDSGPSGSSAGGHDCAGGDFADGTDAASVHICKPVPSAAGELGAILGGD